ncbi:uncharacterized protein BDCG_06834 [Blastomyces dermatitidis ER-3]|uniref:Uncharacterized protein n=3 Tax=Blastomyces TaxID=229219 RepID=A0A179UZ73_BLAGS|nr:uncharacterized protein BDBG_08605 [Blastomyces gilchristii SLH14081]XP_045278196.1 uncharacterized protein BDCG_06834 [Blastomyces dermatitidis ER-3]EEQ91714.2 hypothetical protein BDCG_06834 [Blastomyces dermatitidis ER-3]EQL31820.1 hypothetical protein BDFG_05874 [Blastomyces dermatitidis ATCC 26199]OAT13396.1 hypothetical protein BDBG_08605 [Blastomyces gilchristii SLH14081]
MGPCIHPVATRAAAAGAAEEQVWGICILFLLHLVAGNMLFNSDPTFTTQIGPELKDLWMKDSDSTDTDLCLSNKSNLYRGVPIKGRSTGPQPRKTNKTDCMYCTCTEYIHRRNMKESGKHSIIQKNAFHHLMDCSIFQASAKLLQENSSTHE